ncbi:response regulator receiver protein [Ruminiclostridium papyrosolvens DSM 2782]|uniref:Response regulator receiver protein n=1 Tax=Ruminiclostridium papyrosolvens DSM 2782 TaxID=588581 RepID=F1TFZ3_9FIRM|nr:LytTR family DNA-binding domain-containing protein [Ruminiclostridium papyrosolvens]EGD46612.1 response regulator receiver protein [Ruminiclostridium papyrosolvens DSM 2782]WES35763.1 LytTR family DNA-binding domain-containing protein [Ruminiclostridium papyrosolvens DSM 2782]
MKVSVQEIEQNRSEQVVIQCYRITDKVNSIISFIKSTDTSLVGYENEKMVELFLTEIFYVEAVDNRVFAYTENKTYQLRVKLYEFEETSKFMRFFRCSKSMVINLMKVDSVYPIFNGRFSAKLFNGEEIIISRRYVSELKNLLGGGEA